MVNVNDLRKKTDVTVNNIKNELIRSIPFKQNIILAGSSPDEWTTFKGHVLSDADVFVMSNTSFLFIKKIKKIQKKYDTEDLKITIDPATFWGMKKDFSFLAFELKSKGEVIHGNKNVFRKIRVNQRTLPKWEGIRELFVRLKYLKKVERTKEINYYHAVKCYLGILNAFLVFNQNYKPRYRERYEEFRKMKFSDKILKRKIQASFDFKFNKITKRGLEELKDVNECEDMIIKYTNYFLGKYLGVDCGLKEKFKILFKIFPTKFYRNLLFVYSIPRKYKPKYLKLLMFNPILLSACLVFSNFSFLKRYLKVLPKDYNEFFEIIQTYPSLVVEKDFGKI